jgi:acetyl-CoA C-acetyltransferase
MSAECFVAGWGTRPFGRTRDGSTPRDWVREVCNAALIDAGLGPDAIDAVIVGTESDFFGLQLAPASLMSDEAGLIGKPVMRVEGGGASGALALRAGVLHILSGLSRVVIVVGYEHTASHISADDVRLLYGLSFDAEIDGMAGASAASLAALSISMHMDAFGTSVRQLAHIAVNNRRNALANPLAHKGMDITIEDVLASPLVSSPYRKLDCSLVSDGAAAIILADGRYAKARRTSKIQVTGTGCANDFERLGDRDDPHRFAGKRASARQAFSQARVRDPAREVDVAELYDSFTGIELQSIEALGFAAEGQAGPSVERGEFDRAGRLPVNLSGGLLGQGGAPGATGVIQAITAAQLLCGEYFSALQPARELKRAVVDCHGGCATVNVTHVLERAD